MSAVVHLGDCLEVMKTLESGSIDMILCDLPYGTTACKWDAIIPFVPLWEQYRRLIKPGRAIILTAAQPFTSALVMSNVNGLKHHWIWDKGRGTGFQVAKYRPMMQTEDVLAFTSCGQPFSVYCPQMTALDAPVTQSLASTRSESNALKGKMQIGHKVYTERFPTNLLDFRRDGNRVHPTQKPVALFEYLIRTYTLPGQMVLDNCAGSGTTGVAAIQCGRKAILIEQDAGYYAIAVRRVANAQPALLGAS